MTKWTCIKCGKVVPKYSIVNQHLEMHKIEMENEKNDRWRYPTIEAREV